MAPTSSFPVPDRIAAHPAWFRLEDQCDYYDRKATSFQKIYKHIKVALIVLAASIPVLSLVPDSVPGHSAVIAVMGAVMAGLEAVLLLNKYPDMWIRYRGNAESLKRERWLVLSRAGEYKGLDDAQALLLLAERVEVLLALEHREWTSEQKKALDQMQHAGQPGGDSKGETAEPVSGVAAEALPVAAQVLPLGATPAGAPAVDQVGDPAVEPSAEPTAELADALATEPRSAPGAAAAGG